MLIFCVHPLGSEIVFTEKHSSSSIRFSELISCILLHLFEHSCLCILIPRTMKNVLQFFQTFSLVRTIKTVDFHPT